MTYQRSFDLMVEIPEYLSICIFVSFFLYWCYYASFLFFFIPFTLKCNFITERRSKVSVWSRKQALGRLSRPESSLYVNERK